MGFGGRWWRYRRKFGRSWRDLERCDGLVMKYYFIFKNWFLFIVKIDKGFF